MKRDQFVHKRDARANGGRVHANVFVQRKTEQVGDRLPHRSHRQRVSRCGFDQRGEAIVGDWTSLGLHRDRGDGLAQKVVDISARLTREGQQRQSERTGSPPHQNACLTRTSTAYVESSLRETIQDRRSLSSYSSSRI